MNVVIETEPKIKAVRTEIYSRVSGYYRPVGQWNKSKQSEFSDREYLNYKEFLNE